MAGVRSVGIVANPERPEVPDTVREAVAWLGRRGLETWAAPDVRAALALDLPAFAWDDLVPRVELLVTFGGDGTILFAARRLGRQCVPIFGVNTGSLGFLTSSSRDSMLESFEQLFAGRGVTETYMRLEARLERSPGSGASGRPPLSSAIDGGGDPTAGLLGLNDVVIHKGAVTARVLDLRLEVDGDEVGTYVADGLILATPAGSTGYTLSAQGPLVVPTMDAIVATPICPHTLAIRPLVLPAGADIRVTVVDQQEAATLAVDGMLVSDLRPGDTVRVTRAEHPVRLVRLPGGSFFRLLRSKLHWGGRAGQA